MRFPFGLNERLSVVPTKFYAKGPGLTTASRLSMTP
jgi:hypothetical protein